MYQKQADSLPKTVDIQTRDAIELGKMLTTTTAAQQDEVYNNMITPPKDEQPKEEPPKDGQPKEEPPKDGESKEEPSKEEPPKDGQPKEEPPRFLVVNQIKMVSVKNFLLMKKQNKLNLVIFFQMVIHRKEHAYYNTFEECSMSLWMGSG